MTTILIVDTNIIASSPRLNSVAWSSMIRNAGDWATRIVVPEVVVMETVNVVRRRWHAEIDRLVRLPLGQFGLADAQAAMVAVINQESDGYEEWLLARLEELGIEIQPVPAVHHMEIARRASAGRTPFTRNKEGKTKDGYRDTLIWLTVLAVAKENPGDTVWLISENHTDFGPKPGDWTGPNTGGREDCPIHFADDLMDELDAEGLDDRVHYVVSAELMEQHLASQFAPIADSDLDQLVAAIDMTTLAGKLMYLSLGRYLDPLAAALPAGVLAGEIIGAHEQQDGWTFSEGARRGDEGWTAQFAVDTEVDIEIAGAPWLGGEHTKILRMIGRVAVSPEGAILDMTVDGAEALPDDPERARRARRRELDVGFGSAAAEALNADLMTRIAAQYNGPNVMSEILKSQNSDLMTRIAAQYNGPNVMSEILKSQNSDLMTRIAAQYNGPNVMSEILKAQNSDLMTRIAAQYNGPNVMSEILKAQNTGSVRPDGESADEDADADHAIQGNPDAEGNPGL
ncbi:PIN domain-containing protein [Mycobacterium kubicae]|uniref:DUF4935 domain-containing protein n=3 Tax=Mycobacterium kubicae TaxID=120959 RepID=A0AAX1J708_9MYCO|nr:PIN domain-containing protein [Mycobacterium kubicae]QPI36976.1 DUF4935 domain-containing protein [Mycobacterium kubicae]